MSQNKTTPTEKDVLAFINAVEHKGRRQDALTLLEFMKELTGLPPKMWGPSIIGFGSYHYQYDSGREGDMLITGFSPRKASSVVYIVSGFKRYDDLLQKLGNHKTGKSCLYINKLDDVDMDVLKELVQLSIQFIKEKYG
ncbi:MAG: DUF1801 domain-containing protein [Bacteroidetes bacterium]|nr:DUF1801 domain-containing protein [Bacteroidota bacterium]